MQGPQWLDSKASKSQGREQSVGQEGALEYGSQASSGLAGERIVSRWRGAGDFEPAWFADLPSD